MTPQARVTNIKKTAGIVGKQVSNERSIFIAMVFTSRKDELRLN